MDFDTLDRRMRGFEQSLDRTMLQGVYIVARLDGHGFTRLTKKEWDLERPFDIRFRNIMVETLRHLMDCGFRIIYGYTQSDEISLLFHLDDETFGRKERKLLSILASEASVAFSMKEEDLLYSIVDSYHSRISDMSLTIFVGDRRTLTEIP